MGESKATTTKDNNIPLIDLSLLNSPNNSSSADSIASLAAEITEACETWGCFQVINHGVPVEQSRAIESAARQFFDQPKEEKKKVWRYERNPLGYHDSEITMNVSDWKEVFDFTVQNPTLFPASPDPHDLELRELVNQWPQFSPQFREVCEEYAKEIEKLGYQLLELLSLSLGLPRQSGQTVGCGTFVEVFIYVMVIETLNKVIMDPFGCTKFERKLEVDEVCGNKEELGSHANDPIQSLTKNDVLEMQFNSEEDANDFYNQYAKVVGFSIRKDTRTMQATKVLSRKWVCSRQGQRAKQHLARIDRKRAARALTRVGCDAHFRIRYNLDVGKYIVTHFNMEHNHPLATSPCVPFLRSHRFVKIPDKAQVKTLHDVGVKTSQIMDLLVQQSGSFANVGFIHKDLHNYIQAERKVEMKDGDAECALAYLCAKADADPYFFYKYDKDQENRLDKLFWADSRSRLDYAAFDDVGGLQVKRKWDGKWVPVKPNPHAYLVIICDIFQVWSNDKYESVVHRAMVNSEKERISIVFFFYPAHYTMVEPLEELINDRNPPKYRPYNWGKFSAARRRSNFTKNNVGRIQIDHFKHPMLILKKVIWCLYVLFMLVENVLPQSDAEMLFNYETENLGTELQRLPATIIESVEALQKDNVLGNLVGENLSEAEIQVRKAEI
ncbi:hypothetical protein ACSBR1_002854 [Camellia fascicularis]